MTALKLLALAQNSSALQHLLLQQQPRSAHLQEQQQQVMAAMPASSRHRVLPSMMTRHLAFSAFPAPALHQCRQTAVQQMVIIAG
jgi:hypothetical protein